MEIDKTTIKDLDIFEKDGQDSIFKKFDHTITTGGSIKLNDIFRHPLKSIIEIKNIQDTLIQIASLKDHWPKTITNGTLMVVHKYYETSLDQIPAYPSITQALKYKLLHFPDFSLVKYSGSHAFDLIKGMNSISIHFKVDNNPPPLQKVIDNINNILNKEQFHSIIKKEKFEDLSLPELLSFCYFIRYIYKENIYHLIDLFYQLDAWRSMGIAIKEYNLSLPVFIESNTPHIRSKDLYHILLPKPVSYHIVLNEENNFIFLTGANMAGKSTFIKSVGCAVFLAHLGMGVPAKELELSLFDGMLSNINVEDNISKGESFFYNEVQRIKNTIIKITDGRKWLVLIDELFKGTNVEDSMTCSTAVIKGLIKIKSSLFILSTHLYEIGEELKKYPNISFKYFETTVDKEQLYFSYQLQNGISNDRLGYLILKREKVIELLDRI